MMWRFLFLNTTNLQMSAFFGKEALLSCDKLFLSGSVIRLLFYVYISKFSLIQKNKPLQAIT